MQHSLYRLEERLAVVERDLRQMHNPHIDRQYLIVGAVIMAAMLVLLLFVTWRLI